MQPVTHQNGGAKQPPTPPPAQPSRMRLANAIRGKLVKPPRVLLYSQEKLGKSTFASHAPSPIFICAEDGTSELDVVRYPEPERWSDVFEALHDLQTSEHEFQTLVIDTLDWLEPKCWAAVCAKAKVSSIEDLPYGKGYVAALDEWRLLLARLDQLRAVKNMGIILLAHSWIKTFKSPDADYDRYEMKIHIKAGGLFKEWCDAVLFGSYEEYTHEKNGRTKAVSTGARLLHTQRRSAWDAGNRYDLPETLPLDWDAFADAVAAHRPASPAHTRARIEAMLTELSNETVSTKVRASVVRAADDAAELARIADKLSGLLQTSEVQS